MRRFLFKEKELFLFTTIVMSICFLMLILHLLPKSVLVVKENMVGKATGDCINMTEYYWENGIVQNTRICPGTYGDVRIIREYPIKIAAPIRLDCQGAKVQGYFFSIESSGASVVNCQDVGKIKVMGKYNNVLIQGNSFLSEVFIKEAQGTTIANNRFIENIEYGDNALMIWFA